MESFKDLLKVNLNSRDLAWDRKFCSEFLKQKIHVVDSLPKPGPDRWPYLFVETSETADESPAALMHWLAKRGIGLVVNPSKATPDYVFTYGMIWNYVQTGEFFASSAELKSSSFVLEDGQQLFAGPPSETFLPPYVRGVLRQFFSDQKVDVVKALMLSEDQIHFDLCFSLESLGDPPEEEHAGIAEALSWFLPPHYSVVLLSEKTVPGWTTL